MVSQIMEIVEGSNIIIQSAFNDYYGDKIFFVATVVCFVYLFVTCKELRYKFLLPIALILFVIINPIVYHYILSRVVYRRIFWMIPNAAIMGAAFVFFLKRQKKVWLKWCVLALITLFIFRYGNNVFQSEVFTRVQNWEKLNEATIFVCDLMKEIDDEPRAIVTQQLFCEVRQYMPEISLMYGRDAHGYIRHCEAYESNTFYYLEVVNPADYEYVLTCATMFGYNFIVVEEWKAIEETLLDKYDFYPVANVAGYIVYYNEEITYVQEDDVRLD